MGRPRINRDIVNEPQTKSEDTKVNESNTEIETSKKETLSDELVLIKTTNADIVVKSNKLKFKVVHISGYGTVHNPKYFYLDVIESKLRPLLTEDEIKDIEVASLEEIKQLIHGSEIRGKKEYAESLAKKKDNKEIQPSEFYK